LNTTDNTKVTFPQNNYSIRVIGVNTDDFKTNVLAITNKILTNTTIDIKPSSNHNYCSVQIVARIESERQLKHFFQQVKQLDGFKICL